MSILGEVRALRDEGKLHRKLLIRTRILIGIGLILVAVAGYEMVGHGIDALLAGALFLAGFLAGMFVFSRMNVVTWDEEKESVVSGRMDTLGYMVLGLYIAFEIGLRDVLSGVFPDMATALILAAVGGTLLGRALGTYVEVHRVYTATHGRGA